LASVLIAGLGVLTLLGCSESIQPITRAESAPPEPVTVVKGLAAGAVARAETGELARGEVGVSTTEGPNRLSPEEIAEGWILLFDGATLFGWQPSQAADWRVEDGAIVATTGTPDLLCTTSQFGDYILRVEFRSEPKTNSGIFLRTLRQVTDASKECYELNIASPELSGFPTGSFVGRKKAIPVEESTDWRQFEVTAEGERFSVRLNGVEVLQYEDPQPLGRGFIGLQFNQGRIAFRNIKLKPLGLKPLFNGQDLSGWKTYPQLAARATVTPEGWLRLQGGRGMIETEQLFGDFTLQIEIFVNGKELNSGVFFRCIPGEQMNGYESQIHNAYLSGDRARPRDCGTGGIFRRQDARRVVANDFEWFSKTIHAAGPHMAVWVNGYQVSDWTDTRPADANPRRGCRVEPGSIMLQGHDPTTDLFFRNIRAATLPPR